VGNASTWLWNVTLLRLAIALKPECLCRIVKTHVLNCGLLSNPKFVLTLFVCSAEEETMAQSEETTEKVHYICQTYVEKTSGRAKQASLQIGKQIQYTTASQAEERANRECRSEDCVGADAYMVIEDLSTGEVGVPTFLARLGTVPEFDAF
jgi:hypothetical protein